MSTIHSTAGIRRAATLLLCAGLAAGLAACSSSSNSGASTGSSSTPASTSTSASAATAAGVPEALFQGDSQSPPTSGPKPANNKTIWWVSCGMSIPDCSSVAFAAQDAAKTLGWKFHVADGKLGVGGAYLTAVRQAIAAKASAIVVHGVDCSAIEQPLQEAKAAGIPVIGVEALDCSDQTPGAPTLFTAPMLYSGGAPSAVEYFKSWGTLIAKYIAAKTDDKADLILEHGIAGYADIVNTGFVAQYKKCTTCKIAAEVKFASADQVPNGPLSQRLKVALLKNTSANAIYMPVDSAILGAGGAQDVQQSGSKAYIDGGTGSSGGLDAVRDGIVQALLAHSAEWMGYAAMDELNRVFAKQSTVPEGIAVVIVDKNHNLPAKAGSSFQSSIDWKAAYEKSWTS
jgi:ribose transport system substrate-binding protein